MWLFVLATILVGYTLGNLNGSVCVSALMHDDVRAHGSGNAGLTNFIRNYGAGRAFLVILIDAGKAVLACLNGSLLLQQYGMTQEGAVIGGVALMLGHDFPALLGFKGGKGILSGLFIALMVDWRIALIVLGVFVLAYLLTQYVSLGSVLAAVVFAACFIVFYVDNLIVMLCGAFMGVLTVYMHRSNILRLVRHQESKTNLFGKGERK